MTSQEFRDLILPLQNAMYRLAFVLVKREDDAADITQETILRLWQKHDEISRTLNHKAYCLTAVRNRALTHLQSHESDSEMPESIESPEDIHDAFESRETLSITERAMESLPANQKEVIRLSSYAGCTNSEIAQITGLTEVNVRALLSRGRKRLREIIISYR